MIDLDNEYALLRATADRAWEIEKRLGMSMPLGTLHSDDPAEWRVGNISRSVATRIAHVATWMKDPKERTKRLLAAEAKRAEASNDDTHENGGDILPRRVAALATPKPQQASSSRRLSDVSATIRPSTTQTTPSTSVRPPSKTWTRPKPAPPVPVDLPWEAANNLPPAKTTNRLPLTNSIPLITPSQPQSQSTKHSSPRLSPLPKSLPVEHTESPHVEPKPLEPPPPTTNTSSSSNPRSASPPPDESKHPRPPTPPTMPRPVQAAAPTNLPPPPSSIGPQVLSSHRSMPSAAFGYGTDVNAMWSLPFLRRLFHDLDGDRDGFVSKLETSIGLHRLHVYVPPHRIATFFNQAATLSQRSVVNFDQFRAFVLAAKEANLQPPQPKQTRTTSLPQPRAPLVVNDGGGGGGSLDIEQVLPDVMAARIMQRMDETTDIDPEVVRELARELMREHLLLDSPEDATTGLDGMQAALATQSSAVEMHPVTTEAHVVDLVKAFMLQHMREHQPTPSPAAPLPVEPLDSSHDNVDASQVAEVPPSVPLEAVDIVPVSKMEQATDTSDLTDVFAPVLTVKEMAEDKLIRNLADLPGKTLLGKLLHCDAIGECNVQVDDTPPTSLAATLRRMRAIRLRNTVPPPPPPPPMSPRPPQHHDHLPPPPPPPVSPVGRHPTNPWQPCTPLAQEQQPTPSPAHQRDEPPGTKMYALGPKPTLPVVPRSVRSSSCSIASSSVDHDDLIDEDLMSEGEVMHVDALSDGEVDGGPAHTTYYHLHNPRRHGQRPSPQSSQSSLEEGQLQTLFVPAPPDDNASSSGSIESGEYYIASEQPSSSIYTLN
ncbi:hypothetical protein H257_06391, partial [Aphanomyces astaci]